MNANDALLLSYGPRIAENHGVLVPYDPAGAVTDPAAPVPAPRGPSVLGTTYALLGIASTAVCTYHGYKRNNGSVGWGIGWGLLGGMFPVIAPAIAIAEGLGEPIKE